MNYPPTKPLTADEEDLIWRFRFYLSSYKKVCNKISGRLIDLMVEYFIDS